MKLSIIGAGPAGAMLAIFTKNLIPNADITIYEKRTREQSSEGIGYTISESFLLRVLEVDQPLAEQFAEHICRPYQSPYIGAKGKGVVRSPRAKLGGIERKIFMDILDRSLQSRNIPVRYGEAITAQKVEEFSRQSDGVILADGMNSVANTIPAINYVNSFNTNLMYAWFNQAKSNHFLSVIFGDLQGTPFVRSEYPLNETRAAVIIETRSEDVAFLNGLDYTNGVRPRPVTIQRRMNISTGNITCIGESWYIPYYATGEGLPSVVTQCRQFAELLPQNGTVTEKFRAWHSFIKSHFDDMFNSSKEIAKNKYRVLSEYERLSANQIVKIATGKGLSD